MPTTQDIVSKLWNLCHVRRDDGTAYHQHVTEQHVSITCDLAEGDDPAALGH